MSDDHEAEPVTNWDVLMAQAKSIWQNYKVLISISLAVLLLLAVVAVMKLGGSETAPDFALTDTEDNTVKLSDYRGQIVVLDLMSTTCKPCEKFADDTLKPLYNEKRAKVVIISVSVGGTDDMEKLRNYKADHGYGWTHVLDEDLEVTTNYRAQFIPKVVVIDEKGRATFEALGGVSKADLDKRVDEADTGTSAIKLRETSLLLFAIGAGVLAFFSPCSFPLLPGYMSYYLNTKHQKAEGLGEQTARAALPAGIAAAAGILVVFMTVAIVVVLLSEAVASYLTLLEPVIGVIILVMGVLLLTDYQYYWLINPIRNVQAKAIASVSRYSQGRVKRAFEASVRKITRSDFTYDKAKEEGLVGLFLYGVGYGSASAGCTAPIFVALLVTSWQAGSLPGSLAIFALYSSAAAVLMVAFTLFVAASEETLLNRLKVSTGIIKKVGGGVLILVGLYLIYFYFSTGGS